MGPSVLKRTGRGSVRFLSSHLMQGGSSGLKLSLTPNPRLVGFGRSRQSMQQVLLSLNIVYFCEGWCTRRGCHLFLPPSSSLLSVSVRNRTQHFIPDGQASTTKPHLQFMGAQLLLLWRSHRLKFPHCMPLSCLALSLVQPWVFLYLDRKHYNDEI